MSERTLLHLSVGAAIGGAAMVGVCAFAWWWLDRSWIGGKIG